MSSKIIRVLMTLFVSLSFFAFLHFCVPHPKGNEHQEYHHSHHEHKKDQEANCCDKP